MVKQTIEKVNDAMKISGDRAMELQKIVMEEISANERLTSVVIQKIWDREDFSLNEKLFSIYGFGRSEGRTLVRVGL